MSDQSLTAKQEQFCLEYMVDLNATQAAIRSGYSKDTAQQIGSENLSKPLIAEKIAQLRAERSERVQIDADYVIENLAEIVERCMQRTEVKDHNGVGTGEYKFEHNGANRALELLGKHLKMFTEKKEMDVNINPISKILEDMADDNGAIPGGVLITCIGLRTTRGKR